MRAAGIPIAGGHTIDSIEPIYGLVALGLVHPSKVKRNRAHAPEMRSSSASRSVSASIGRVEEGRARARGLRAHGRKHDQLNTPGRALSELAGVHALTDVTGFGLLGHLIEIALGAGWPRAFTHATSRCCRASWSWPRRATSLARLAATGQAMAAM